MRWAVYRQGMRGLIDEINEIPLVARKALEGHAGLVLPTRVPYVGMGSSYYASLVARYAGREIDPQIASEYYGYLSPGKLPQGVLLSQSGESSETVWCRDLFDSYVAIVNDFDSTLVRSPGVSQAVDLMAGTESYSSTKTYINTLVVLFLGLGIDPTSAVEKIERDFTAFSDHAQKHADAITAYIERNSVTGCYVVGSGPNVGTASQVGLVLSETLKRSWVSMQVAQYDHGPKETADNSIVLLLDARGREAKRMSQVREMLSSTSALVVDIVEDELGETLSSIPLAVRSFLLMNALADRLGVGDTFSVGGKVTLVSDEARPS